MIVVRAPLRITLGGGGTDDPEYATEHGGFAITAAISKYVLIVVNDTFAPGYFLKYSETEHTQTIDEIRHPIIREALRYHDIPPHVEIACSADIPAGTGLGSSGAFTVALCYALAEYQGYAIIPKIAATRAAGIELRVLGGLGGCQDHWATALGGIRTLQFGRGGYLTETARVNVSTSKLKDHLSLYFTGYFRSANDVLSTQTHDGLDEIKALGLETRTLIQSERFIDVGALMNEHWKLKLKRSPEMSNNAIDHFYDMAIRNGAAGGKLIGAGGGGFLLFVTEDRDRLSKAMKSVGLDEVDFLFDSDGVKTLR